MSMGPESFLFSHYEAQLDEQIVEQEIQARFLAALNTIDRAEVTTDSRTMMDAREVDNALRLSSVPDARRIGEAIYTPLGDRNPNGTPPAVRMSPAYDHFERQNIPCATYVATVNPVDSYPPYTVYRIVLATTAQRTLPDCRGLYIARGMNDSVLTVFRIDRQPPERRGLLSSDGQMVAEHIKGAGRIPVLEELEKAAAVSPPRQRRTSW